VDGPLVLEKWGVCGAENRGRDLNLAPQNLSRSFWTCIPADSTPSGPPSDT
jgi:hypothetical protein